MSLKVEKLTVEKLPKEFKMTAACGPDSDEWIIRLVLGDYLVKFNIPNADIRGFSKESEEKYEQAKKLLLQTYNETN